MIGYAAFLFLLVEFCAGNFENIKMNEKGLLNNILIFVPDNVPEDRFLFDKIKSVFTAASNLLYEMTSNMEYPFSRLQFGNVYIRIPKSWGKEVDAFDKVRWQMCSKSNFIISDKFKGNFKRMQGFGCKKSGFYTFIGKEYLRKSDIKIMAEEIINEFVLQRYGIIAEAVYQDNITDSEEYKVEKTQNVSCNPKGEPKTKGKNRFDDRLKDLTTMLNKEGNISKNCNYSYTASFQHFTCKGSSIEDVALIHPDFKNQLEVVDMLEPSFLTVKKSGTYVVIVLDTSSCDLLAVMKMTALKMVDEFDDIERFFLIFGSEKSDLFEIVLSNKDEDFESFKYNIESINSTTKFHLVKSFKLAYDVTKESSNHKIFLVLTAGNLEENEEFKEITELLIKHKVIVNIAYFNPIFRIGLCKVAWKTGGFYRFMKYSLETTMKPIMNTKRFCELDIGAIEISRKEIYVSSNLMIKVKVIIPLRYHKMVDMKIKLNLTHIESNQEKTVFMSDLGLGSDDLLGDDVFACDLYAFDFPIIGNYEFLVYIETRHYIYEIAWDNVIVLQNNLVGLVDVIPPAKIDYVKCFKKREKIYCSWFTVGDNGVRGRIIKYEVRIRTLTDNRSFLRVVFINEEPLFKIFEIMTIDRVSHPGLVGISIRGVDDVGNRGVWSNQVVAKEKIKVRETSRIFYLKAGWNDTLQDQIWQIPQSGSYRKKVLYQGIVVLILINIYFM